jgi:hypothetical protein
MAGTFWISCFFYSCYMHLLKSFYFISIESLLLFFFWQHSWPFFHFYLYNVKKENTLHFEIFEKSYFILFLMQFCYTIPNLYKSLSSMVVCANMEPKLFRCVTKLHQVLLPIRKDFLKISIYLQHVPFKFLMGSH